MELYEGFEPKEGKPTTFLGCYILKWGKTDQPTIGFNPIYVDFCNDCKKKIKEAQEGEG